ncbi:hypothetical protein [Haloterrigena salifodinae]|uniref:hypothetical protein n=1 Tax=Haloterrigena salifodinae TaxID=2675099 RepID=UPI000F8882A2|nr:hypothetical protein [Haloterrigena salifodinae]
MIKFELKNEYGGWKVTGLPDSLRFVVQTPTKSITFNASLEELLRAYGHIYHEKDGVIPVYTSTLEFTFHDDTCRLSTNAHSTQIDTCELRNSFEDLLLEIFQSKNGKDPGRRGDQFEHVSTKLRKKGIGYDVFTLHDSLVDD